MFFPVSKPRHVYEAEPKSIVGYSNALQSLSYRIRKLTPFEYDAHIPYSEMVPAFIKARADTSELTNSTPFFTQHITQPSTTDLPNPSVPNDSDVDTEVRNEVLAYLNGKLNDISSEPPDGSRPKPDPTQPYGGSIHGLGKNRDGLLPNSSGADSVSFSSANGSRRIGANNFLTKAEASLRNQVVDVSKVFDLSDENDVDLFGFSASDIEDNGKDDETEKVGSNAAPEFDNLADAMVRKLKIRSDEPQSQLDDELDIVIGESVGITGDLQTLKKKKARLAKRGEHIDDVVWASEDATDVSDFFQLVPEPAIEYPFNLDTFQKRAVYRLERDENVFVAAHTSAGKTVVAEYAIALAMQRKTKVIYTSPIKTLSNQKFRDFSQRFSTQGFEEGGEVHYGQVGIITGDLSINPEADCLIMTTEILRSMLYKGADLIRDLSHVIFDECHWLNDPERGVVWEESIIMLPRSVTIVMLSATVPNAMEFAKWVGTTKEKPVHVVSTPKRPVPLSHQIFVKGETFNLFESSQAHFLDANYRRALAHHKESTKNLNIRQGMGRHHAWMPIIKYIRKLALDPAIFFCFSKKKCEEAAEQLNSQDMTSGAADKGHIHQFYQTAISRLSPADRDVPQITRHREMLKRGIGVHHAGLLPIIKEITEVLFQSGYIRVLFATETFAMGVNMPARTVVFTAIHKYDSQSYRLLEPGEYIQMAGRAGRRGLDDVGTVILYPTTADFPSESDVKSVIFGTPKPLRSQFRLTYNMILNLLRIEELRVEDVMARSFSEAPAGRTSGTIRKLLNKGTETLFSLRDEHGVQNSFQELFDTSVLVEDLSQTIGKEIVAGKNNAQNILHAGRVILVRAQNRTFQLGVIIKGLSNKGFKTVFALKPRLGTGTNPTSPTSLDEVRVASVVGGAALAEKKSPMCACPVTRIDLKSKRKQYNCSGIIIEVGNVPMSNVDAILDIEVAVNGRDLNPIRGDINVAALSAVADELKKIIVKGHSWMELPSVHPIRDLGLQGLDSDLLWMQRSSAVNSMLQRLRALQETGAIDDLADSFERLSRSSRLENKLQKLRDATSDETLQLMPEYRQRALALRHLGYIDGTTVLLKGRAACEVNTCESIILTELVFEQILQKLNAIDLAAVLSALVFTERVEEGEAPGIEELQQEAPEAAEACLRMDATLRSVGDILSEYGVGTSGVDYVRENVRFGFVKGVRDWAGGKTFVQVCAVYNGVVPEGSIVRTIVRLCELLRELRNVARVIGDPELQKKAQEAVDLCKRDVIFAASLYVA